MTGVVRQTEVPAVRTGDGGEGSLPDERSAAEQPTEVSSTSSTLLHQTCPGCQGSVPLAVIGSDGTAYFGWICAACLAAGAGDGLLDVIDSRSTYESAVMDLLGREYWASLEPPAR
jgi:hypothetical protein